MGKINTGGAKKRSGDNIALASAVAGTTLKLTPPKGYYDGSTGLVTLADADFIASNIKNGINLFGITGNFVGPILSTGAYTLASAPTLRSSNSGTFVKLKEITVPYNGTIGWYYAWQYAYYSQTGYFDLRKNDVVVDRLERTVTSSVFDSRTGTIAVSAGDKLQIWFACSINGAGFGEVQSFSLASNLQLPVVDID